MHWACPHAQFKRRFSARTLTLEAGYVGRIEKPVSVLDARLGAHDFDVLESLQPAERGLDVAYREAGLLAYPGGPRVSDTLLVRMAQENGVHADIPAIEAPVPSCDLQRAQLRQHAAIDGGAVLGHTERAGQAWSLAR